MEIVNQNNFLWKGLSDENIQGRRYFKTGCVGTDRSNKITDLEKTKTNKKTAKQIKIDKQIISFGQLFSNYGIIIYTTGHLKNTNITQQRVLNIYGKEVFMEATADIISPVSFKYGQKKYNYDSAIIDLQITGDLENTYGSVCWGTPQNMNHNYAYFFSVVFGLPFVYWIFDYNNKANKMLPKINHITMNEYNDKQKKIIKDDYAKFLSKLNKFENV